jgi:DNA-binding beta-propeller fold protein YncE
MLNRLPYSVQSGIAGLTLLILTAAPVTAHASEDSFIGGFNNISTISTTVPANGDVNPYGIAEVPVTRGKLVRGQILISNFNNSANAQGTGTTIVEVAANGSMSTFAQINTHHLDCPGGVGLTTALVALRSGYVIVGSLPAAGGMSANAKAGCLIVLDANGDAVETITDPLINGPWDMTAVDGGDIVALFVTNVLNGTVAADGSVVNEGTVVRILLGVAHDFRPFVLEQKVIASGFPERTDPAALVIGPTGVAFDFKNGNLYVADTLNNRIVGISNALFRHNSGGTGWTVTEGGWLNSPLGLTFAPNGHLLSANGGDGNIVETRPFDGDQVAKQQGDGSSSPPGAGALFGLVAVSNGVYYVDDATNTLNLLN